jgi:hypothetical protein
MIGSPKATWWDTLAVIALLLVLAVIFASL